MKMLDFEKISESEVLKYLKDLEELSKSSDRVKSFFVGVLDSKKRLASDNDAVRVELHSQESFDGFKAKDMSRFRLLLKEVSKKSPVIIAEIQTCIRDYSQAA